MTDQTKGELLPCPFCGGADELVIQEGVDAYVVCDQCVIVGPTGTDAKAAALRWNRRARLAPAAPLKRVGLTDALSPQPDHSPLITAAKSTIDGYRKMEIEDDGHGLITINNGLAYVDDCIKDLERTLAALERKETGR